MRRFNNEMKFARDKMFTRSTASKQETQIL